MTNNPYLSRLWVCMLTLGVFFVSACGITPPDAWVPGSRHISADEYVSRFAGNSIRFDVTPNGQGKYREIYFAKDGTLQAVNMFNEAIEEGTWAVNSSHLVMNSTYSGFSDGKPFRTSPSYYSMYVYVLADGTASVFTRHSSGPAIVTQPKPTPGFQSRGRFNSIKRKVSNALD